VGKVTMVASSTARGVVGAQKPTRGTQLKQHAKISLFVSNG
jgi:beta-lactam-binding protein with PASTA domain